MSNNDNKGTRYLTQKQLAQRWHLSESCVKNYRAKGIIPFFQLPNSARVLYPVLEIERIESEHTKMERKEGCPKPAYQRKALEVSSTDNRDKWRI